MLLRPTLRTLILAPMVCLGLACSDDNTPGVSGTAGNTDSGSTSDEPTGTTGVAFEPIPARGGIVINRVEANSGVAVPIGRDGEWVDGSGRNAYIPARRDTLIRAYVDVPDGWVGRELEGRLRLTGGGVDKELSSKIFVEADSRDSGIESTFYWGLVAEDVQPGLEYSITLWETAPGQEDTPAGEVPPQAPLSGSALVGVEAASVKMRVVLVPIDYSFGDCNAVIDGAKWGPIFEEALYQQNPVEELEFLVREPFKVTYDLTSFSGLSNLVSDMSELRTVDGADPNVYYYGFFDNCGECIGSSGDGFMSGCTVGLAADITGPDMNDAWARASAGQLIGAPEDTFVHEIGHTQGRRHIECPGGGAAGVDPSYPHDNGKIGVWGFGIRDYRLRHPSTNTDYMSYCGPTWVSDWQWNATYNRAKLLTSWDSSAAPQGEGLLIGAIDGDQQRWWTVPGTLGADAPRSATHSVDFVFADGTDPVAAKISLRPEGDTLNVVAPLPAGFDARELQGLVLRAPEGATQVKPDAVRWLHRPERIKAAN